MLHNLMVSFSSTRLLFKLNDVLIITFQVWAESPVIEVLYFSSSYVRMSFSLWNYKLVSWRTTKKRQRENEDEKKRRN